MSSEEKEYAAFLSFADPDRELVEALRDLLDLVGESAYFAPDNLPLTGSPEWREEIAKAIRRSHSFVPIYTRHSLNRPWVLYETGMADAHKLTRFPAHVSSVSVTDIGYLPAPLTQCYDLSNKRSLTALVTHICKKGDKANGTIEAKVRREIKRSDLTQRIITLARTRWVFIAGNTPKNAETAEAGIEWYETLAGYESRLGIFVETLTERLLKCGFSISACPQVTSVGRPVTRKALGYLDAKKSDNPVNFRISGIYPIDREAREIQLSDTAMKKWLDYIMAFRKTYLADQEWLVLVGGTEGTREEYRAAKECGVKIFPIPCFGGTAAKIFDEEESNKHNNVCRDCRKKDGTCGPESIKKIAKCLESKM